MLIAPWLKGDKKAPRKQRHTASKIFHRLENEAESFDCSYCLVSRYVSHRKEELKLVRSRGYLPLVHCPGEAQADLGASDFYESDVQHSGKYFTLSFPYSNVGYIQLKYGQNMECLLESMRAIFEHIGGVPQEIWFDNTITIVTQIIKGGDRDITGTFYALYGALWSQINFHEPRFRLGERIRRK